MTDNLYNKYISITVHVFKYIIIEILIQIQSNMELV